MKTLVLLVSLLIGGLSLAHSQYGYGYGGYGYGYGRQRSMVPQADTPKSEPEPKTAEELVDGEMPDIQEAVGLNDFEAAVVRSILTRYVQKRMELQILKLTPEATREALQKIGAEQRKELEMGLPADKYEAMIDLEENGYNAKKFKKKQKKKKT